MASPTMSVEAEVTPGIVDLAERRTTFLFRHLQFGEMPMKKVLASAYLQGMNDMFDTLEARGLVKLR